jgi:diguanylate cyclase (GGDEF)-like protein
MGNGLSNAHPRDQLSAAQRIGLQAAFALLLGTIAAAAVNVIFAVGSAGVEELMRTWAPSAVYILTAAIVVLRAVAVKQSRTAWILFAVGLSLYCAGNLAWALWLEHLDNAPIPSVADALWLSLYPASYAGLLLLARRGRTRTSMGVWLDGIVTGLGIAALGAAVVVRPILDSASGSSLAVATNLAYPVADLLMAGLLMSIFALRGWRLETRWILLGGGFLVLCVADILYLLQVAAGSPEAGVVPNLFYMSGVALLAFSAWKPARTHVDARDRLDGWSVLLVPGAFSLTAVALMLHDHFDRLDPLALTLAISTLLLALLRTFLSFRDLQSLAQTRRDATTDDLTSLPNRRLFMRTVDAAIRTARTEENPLALLIIDLDQFKELNDALGHRAGDELLRQIGPRLDGLVRSTDLLARLGGDEFGLLLGPGADREAALLAAARVRDALQEPFEVHGLRMNAAASIGIALYPSDGDDAQRLLQHADVAMYNAKAAGNAYEFYAGNRDEHSRDALELASELSDAITDGQLELHFQPISEARTGTVVGMEALVRWAHPTRGILPPDAFIPIAEQSGQMRDLTRWIVDAALERARAWRGRGHRLRLSVNVSVPDLLDVDFPGEVTAALARYEVDPCALILEVTETSIMSDRVRISDVLGRLGEIGVGLSLDDFGTGYSSLLHLKTLPVSEVKIDRGFVAGMRTDPTDREIVRSTIQLARNLGLGAVAEGVEDEETWRAVRDLGCTLVQGYHLARPLPAGEVEGFLAGPHPKPPPYTNLLKTA